MTIAELYEENQNILQELKENYIPAAIKQLEATSPVDFICTFWFPCPRRLRLC